MLLGDLIERLSDPAVAAEVLLSLEPLALCARIGDLSRREGVTAGEFSARAIKRFIAKMSDEDWLTLVGLMSRSPHPGNVLLQRALLAAVERDARDMAS